MSNQQKEVKSSERSTGMGANSFTAIVQDGQWVAVSNVKGRTYCGRENGWENFKISVDENAPHADFYRSNRGNESVVIFSGDKIIEVKSFELADEWLRNNN